MDEITIRGYKSIKDQTVEIRPINVLIGGNGAGKSNFISFFQFLKAYLEDRMSTYVKERGGIERLLFMGPKRTEILQFRAAWHAEKATYSLDIRRGESGPYVDKEAAGKSDEFFDLMNREPGSTKDAAGFIVGQRIKNKLRDVGIYHFNDTGRNSKFSQPSHVINDSYYLYSDGHNLAAVLYDLQRKHPLSYKRLVKVIRSVAPYFLDFFVPAEPGEWIRLQWRDQYSDTIYGPNDLSDGTLRYIVLATALLQPELPSTIIIDEPELGLHPRAVAKLGGMIKQAAQRGSKVIVATQSTSLISYFEPENVITVDNVDGASQFRRLRTDELEHWLEDYTLGNLWSRNIIEGGQP